MLTAIPLTLYSSHLTIASLEKAVNVSRAAPPGKSSESVQCAMLKACDACTDMGQL